MTDELDRLKGVYKERESINAKYNPVLPENYYLVNSREKIFIKSLYDNFGTDFSNIKVLDLGFCSGIDIFTLIKSGFNPQNIYGVEVIEERYNRLKTIIPTTNLKLSSGFSLPFEDESFELIIQSTVFSSILSPDARKELADEMLRVLKPKGKIFFYDLKYNNPWNSNVLKMDKKEINRLFSDFDKKFVSVTLNPIVVRKIAKISIILCEILEKIPFFCSHYYTVITKN